MDAALAELTCSVCPAQVLDLGEFDVSDKPGPDSAYDPKRGYRVNCDTNAPTCVHPYRVGVPAGAYCSNSVPLPVARVTAEPMPSPESLVMPSRVEDLEGWMVAVLRVAGPARLERAIADIETHAEPVFGGKAIVSGLRRALSGELVRAH